jgi:prephenate dehydrogenase
MMKRATIIGLGMMGASFALALKKFDVVRQVNGVDIQPEVVVAAKERGIVIEATTNLAEGVALADLVVLATPVCTVMKLLHSLAEIKYPGIIIDLGSTKHDICETARRFPNLNFIGCHPMAGSEVIGLKGANANLFVGAKVIITPIDTTDSQSLETVQQLWRQLNSHIVLMDTLEHDQSVAVISHLPYTAAVATMQAAFQLGQNKQDVFSLAAGGFRDTTRVSEGDPQMWRDILFTNRSAILQGISALEAELSHVRELLLQEDCEGLNTYLTQVRRNRIRHVRAATNC